MSEVIVVNEKDEIVGTMGKEEAHRTGAPHRIAVVYVENKQGQVLVQIRADGGTDHSCAGHVDPGESYLEAANRELEEELGIMSTDLVYVGKGFSQEPSSRGVGDKVHVFDIFRCVAEPVRLQAEEVKEVYWADPEEVLKEMNAKQEDKDKIFCQGFIVSLPIYLKSKKHENPK